MGPALRTIEVGGEQYPRGIPKSIASLFSRTFSTAASSSDSKTVGRAYGSLTLSRADVAMLIEILLSARAPDNLEPSDNLGSALAETAWTEADDGLARALQQTPALRQAIR